jgi:hypothetical protein
MTRHETVIQYAKTILLAAILVLAVWSFGGRQVSASPPQAGGATGQPVPAFAQLLAGTDGTNLRGVSTDSSGRLNVNLSDVVGTTDPCQSPAAQKNSVQVTITTATTTALVAVSGSTVVYSCGFQIVASDTTTANTVQLEYGSGAACATSPIALTPNYNTGVQTAGAIPFILSYGTAGQSSLKPTPTGNGVCALTTVGSTPSIQILYTYVQQ